MLIKQLKRILPWCWLAFCAGSFLLFLHQGLLTMMDSDMASEMVMANHIASSGQLFPTDWFYSTEIHLLNNLPIFFVPFFRFIDSWHWVRLLGTVCAYGCLLLSFYYLCSQLKLQRCFPFAASAFFLPLSDIYAYVILIGCYYLPYAILSFLFLGMLIHCVNTSRKVPHSLLLVAVGILGFLLGMTSLRMVLQLILPVTIAAFLLYCVFPLNSNKLQTKQLFSISVLCLMLSGIGYLFNSKILSRFFVFQQYEDIIFTEIHFSVVVELLNDFLNHLGYQSGGMLFSSALLRAVLCLILLFLSITGIIALWGKSKCCSLEWKDSLPVVVCFSGLLFLVLFSSASTMPYSSNYLIPSMVLIPVTITISIVRLQWSKQIKKALVVVVMLLLLFCGVDTCRTYSRGEDSRELQQISASLVQDGYTEGYSTFWRGNLVTELSDGKLDMRVWDTSDHMDITSVNPFLQLKSHETTVPQGKTFIILSKYFNEHTDIALATWLQPEDIYWVSKDYLVYGYESYDDLLHRVNQSCTSKLRNRKVEPSSAASLSPIPLYPGSYTVSITGEQLDGLQVACTHTEGTLTPSQITCASGTLTFRLDTADLLHDLQIDLQNDGTQSAMLESFHLQKDSGR